MSVPSSVAVGDELPGLSIPVTRTNRLDDLPEDPHLKAVGFFEKYDHPQAGTYVAMKPPVKFTGTPSNIRRPAVSESS